MAVTLPSTTELIDGIDEADPVLCHEVRKHVNTQVAKALRPQLEELLAANEEPAGEGGRGGGSGWGGGQERIRRASRRQRRWGAGQCAGILACASIASAGAWHAPHPRPPLLCPTGEPYRFNAASAARRALKGRCLALLSTLGDEAVAEDLLGRFRAAANMQDKITALALLADCTGPQRTAGGCTAALQQLMTHSACTPPPDALPAQQVSAPGTGPTPVSPSRPRSCFAPACQPRGEYFF
jgi:hypothetical protein